MLATEIGILTLIAEEKLDLPAGTINVKQKTEEQVLARSVICNILMQGGVTPAKLSQYFCKHRTNFYHYKKLHNSYMENPRQYPLYNHTYREVMDAYEKRTEVDLYKRTLHKLELIDDIENNIAELQEHKRTLKATV